MFSKIIPHLYLGDVRDAYEFFKSKDTCKKPYLLVDVKPFFNILSADPNPEELMVGPLLALSKSVAVLVHNGIDVYVYCQAGLERSPFLSALVLFQLGRGSLEECYQTVKDKRPQVLVYQAWVDAYLSTLKKRGWG